MSDGVDFKALVNGKEVDLRLLVENLDIERKCDMEYHVAYTQLMKKGILPKATLEKQMGELDIWTESDEEGLTKIQSSLAGLHIKLEAATTHEEGLTIAQEMGSLRADCLRLIEAKAAVLSNSCESLADSIRRDAYIAYGTVFADTNKRVFADYQDLILRASEPAVEAAREQLLILATRSFQESLTSLPEVHYVQSVEVQIRAEADKLEEVAVATKKKVTKKGVKKTAKKKTTKKTT
jgi:dsRNA-specific ribonuclease